MFQLILGSNDHYDQFITAARKTVAQSRDETIASYGSYFSGACAFSVFTRAERVDFLALLKLLAALLQPGGELLFTAFLLTPYSRNAIERRASLFPFG